MTNRASFDRFPQPDDIFQVRVTLLEVEPAIWRSFLVEQDISLPRLHGVLQAVMGWTNSHLHQFRVGEIQFGEPQQEYEPGPIDYRNISLNQVARHPGSQLVYEYDFGDGWEHVIEVEGELAVETVAGSVPRCLAGERACPPEDCGGPHSYATVLEALADPTHPEHDEWRTWAGPKFDPEAFDQEKVNRLLGRFAPRAKAGSTRAPRRR